MATKKPVKRPKVVGPFEGVHPPEGVGAPPPPPPRPPVNELEMSPELERRLVEEYEQDLLRDASGQAAERSRRASMGTLDEPPPPKPAVKKAKGGSVGSASRRADGCAVKGKTRGRFI